MKRVKAACILQTQVFQQKEDSGLSRDAIAAMNREEVQRYKHNLERTRYQITGEEEQEDGSILVRVRKQYNDRTDVYFS
ncbi:hypothetical protein MR626_13345 [bacterium]|nr:hypothetical protein [bacterium]MDY4582664.1 hypothetical protein [Candidatus Faecousia sp.]